MEKIFEEIKRGDHYLKWINEVAENPFMPLPKWGIQAFTYEGLIMSSDCLSFHYIPDQNLTSKDNYEFIISIQDQAAVMATDKIRGNIEEKILFRLANINETFKSCMLHIEGYAKIFNQDNPTLKFNYLCPLSVLLESQAFKDHVFSKNEKRSFSFQIEKTTITSSPVDNQTGNPINSFSKKIIVMDFSKVIAFPYYDADKSNYN